MARYCRSLAQANNTVVTHNAFTMNRQPDSAHISTGITKSPFKAQTQRFPQGPSTRPPGRKTKALENTCRRISQQGRFDVLAPLPLHLSYLYARRTYPSDSALTTELWTVSQYQTSTHYHSLVNYLTTQRAESGLQGWTSRMGTSW